MEKLNEVPNIEIQFGGPATADEVYNDSEEIRIVINELIEASNRQEEAIKHLAWEVTNSTAQNIFKEVDKILNPKE